MKKSCFSIDNLITSNLNAPDQHLTMQTSVEKEDFTLSEKSFPSDVSIFSASKLSKVSPSANISMRNLEKKEKLFLQKFITDQQQQQNSSAPTIKIVQTEEKDTRESKLQKSQLPSLLFQNSFSGTDPVCTPVSLAHFGSLAAAAGAGQFYPGVNEAVAGMQFGPNGTAGNSDVISPVSSGYSPVNSLDLMTQRSMAITSSPGRLCDTISTWEHVK